MLTVTLVDGYSQTTTYAQEKNSATHKTNIEEENFFQRSYQWHPIEMFPHHFSFKSGEIKLGTVKP